MICEYDNDGNGDDDDDVVININPIECGGGLEEPPLSYKCGSSKNAQRKSC